MPAFWYVNRDREENRKISRMLRNLPIRYVRARDVAPPFPPLRVTPFCNSPAAQETRASRAMRRWENALLIILAALILVLTILCAIGGSLAEEQPTQMYVTVSGSSWLNGRSAPDTHSSVEARFAAGDTVDVYEVSGDWARVAGGECGTVWCDIRYLSATAPGGQPETCTVNADGRVRVRETLDGSTVRWLRNGDTVQVQCRIDGWAYIGDGYVLEKYLEADQ
jgi:uncharacterized protein YgiM (DUF1202 family)